MRPQSFLAGSSRLAPAKCSIEGETEAGYRPLSSRRMTLEVLTACHRHLVRQRVQSQTNTSWAGFCSASVEREPRHSQIRRMPGGN